MGELRARSVIAGVLPVAIISLGFLVQSKTTQAAEVLVNGGFETGDFTGWSLDNFGSDFCMTPWVVAGSNTIQCPTPTGPVGGPAVGTRAIYSAWDGTGSTRRIRQTFTVESGGLTVGNLSWYESYSWSIPAGTLPRTMSVSFYDDTDTLIGTVSTSTISPGTAGFVDWTQFNFNVQAMLAGQAGRQVTIEIYQNVPEVFTGPAVAALDAFSLDLQYLCSITGGDDTCVLAGAPPAGVVVDGVAGTDTLQLGGASNFSFDVATIGAAQDFRNFELFQKAGTSNVTLTGAASEVVAWEVLAGTLTTSGGDAIADLAGVNVAVGGTLALAASETIGSLTGAGTVALGANTLTVGGNDLSTSVLGNITGTGSLVKTGTGTLTLGGANTYTGTTQVNGGVLAVTGGNAIANTAGVNVAVGGTFRTTVAETIGSLSGAGALDLASTLTTGGGASSTFSGTSSGVGGLVKVGTSTFTMTGPQAYTGLTSVNAGELRVNGSLAGSVSIGAGGTLGGNTTINGTLTNLGILSPGNSPGTTTVVGNYVGGGSLLMEVQFNNVGTPINGTTHDFVSIGGNVTGNTLLNVVAFPPSDAPVVTTGNGIELVRVAGNVTESQFALAAPVTQGAIEYILVYMPDFAGSLDGFFLQSTTRSEFTGDAAMLAAGQAMTNACFRGGELIGDHGKERAGRAWVTGTTGNRTTGVDTGIDSEQNFSCASGGVDGIARDNFRLGIAGGYGNTEVDIQTATGVASLEGEGEVIQAFGSYTHGPLFVDVSVGYGRVDWTYSRPASGGESSTTTRGAVGSLLAGVLWPMNQWRLGAMVELAYDDMTCANECLLAGTVADLNNWFVKGTMHLEGALEDGNILPFLEVSLLDGIDTTSVRNGGTILDADTLSGLLQAKAGLTAYVGEKTALFANIGLVAGRDNYVTGVDGSGGVKIFW